MLKTVRILLAMLLCLFMVPTLVAIADGESQGIGATSGTCGTNLTWALRDDGTLTISGTGSMTNYNYSAAAPWEQKKSAVKNLVIESGVTSVGSYALSGCDNLLTVMLPEGLKTIGNYAFSACSGLKTIQIPDTVTTIGDYAFQGCSALTAAVIPDSVTSLGMGAFSFNSNLRNVTLSAGLTEINSNAFSYCRIANLTIPEGITQIGSNAFDGDSTLSELHLPVSLETIGSSAFRNCSGLTDVYYSGTKAQAEAISFGTGNTYLSSAVWHFGYADPTEDQNIPCGDNLTWRMTDAGVLKISGSGAMFDYAAGEAPWSDHADRLTSVELEYGVSAIGENAFQGCVNVLNLNLPSTVVEVKQGAFESCTNLTVVNYSGSSVQKELVIIADNNLPLLSAGWHCADGESDGIGAMSGTCGTNLTWALSTDGTLTITGTGAMKNYDRSTGTPWEARKSAIKTVVVGTGVTSLGNYAFSGCNALTSVSLPNGLRTVGNNTFASCKSLVSITLPSTVTSIGSETFSYCERLKNVQLSDQLETIGYYAFSNCYDLRTIELPDSVTSMGMSVFENCSQLQQVRLSNSLTTVSNGLFRWCAIEELTIPEGVTSIDESAFNSNTALITVTLPETIETVSSAAFGGCSNITDVYYAGTQAEAEAIQIGTGNTYLSAAKWHFEYTLEPMEPEIPVFVLNGLSFAKEYDGTPLTLEGEEGYTVEGELGNYRLNVAYNSATEPSTVDTIADYALYDQYGNLVFSKEQLDASTNFRINNGTLQITPRRLELIAISDTVTTTGEIVVASQLSTWDGKFTWGYMQSGLLDGHELTGVEVLGSSTESFVTSINTANIQVKDGDNDVTAFYEIVTQDGYITIVNEMQEPEVLTLTLPNMLTTIESEAFAGTAAQKIVVPDSVDYIRSRAFADSMSLQELYFEGSPFTIANDILDGCGDVTVNCLKGSSAAKWATRLGLTVIYH